MPNPPSSNRQYFRFKAGEKPSEPDLNPGLVEKLDADVDNLFDSVATLEATDTTIINRLDQFSDSAGNLTVSPPEFSAVSGTPTFVSGTTFSFTGNKTADFRVNGKIQAVLTSTTPIGIVDSINFNGAVTTVTLTTSILDSSLSEIRRSHVLDSFPQIDGGTDIKLSSITQDRLAPGVGGSSSFSSDVSINKADARLFVNSTTGNPKLDLYAVAGATTNRRRLLVEIESTTNLVVFKRLTDGGSVLDTIANANLVSGIWDFPLGINLGVKGAAVGTANAETISGLKTFSTFPKKSGTLIPTASDEFTTKDYVDTNSAGALTSQFTNRTGSTTVVGDVVAVDTANNKSVVVSDVAGSTTQYVVARAAISNLSLGSFATSGVVTGVKAQGPITLGRYLIKSATSKAVEDSGVSISSPNTSPAGAIGYSLTSLAGTGTGVVDVLMFGFSVPRFSRTRIRKSATQNIGASATAAISFNLEDYDVGNIHDTSTNNSRIVFDIAGVWALFAIVNKTGVGSGEAFFRIGGSTEIGRQRIDAGAEQETIYTEYFVSSGSYVELMFTNLSSSNSQTIETGTIFGARRVS